MPQPVSGVGASASPASYNQLAMLLYYITDRRAFAGTDAEQRAALLGCITEAARAGVDYIQLREKDLDPADLELLARKALQVVRGNSTATRLLINSQVELALSVGADGVQLPANSPPAHTIFAQWLRRAPVAPIIGVSAHTVNGVQVAQLEGASFAMLAPIFEKVQTGAKGIGVDVLREACASSGMPVLALGGVTLGNTRACLEAGAAGVAGIRLFQQGSVSSTVSALRWLAQHASR
jgi:thiamine-phosphate pyrophosphorylase